MQYKSEVFHLNIETLRDYILSKPGAVEYRPFGEEVPVFKVGEKMFALFSGHEADRTSVNLKGLKEENDMLRMAYEEIIPGYHMNKVHWNTVYLDGTLEDDFIFKMVDLSYELVFKSLTKKLQKEVLESASQVGDLESLLDTQYWIYPANPKYYDIFGAFDSGKTPWPINSKVAKNDIVFIYVSAPFKRICYQCRVLEIDVETKKVMAAASKFVKTEGEMPDKKFMMLEVLKSYDREGDNSLAYSCLKENGLTGMLMGPRKLNNNQELMDYVLKNA